MNKTEEYCKKATQEEILELFNTLSKRLVKQFKIKENSFKTLVRLGDRKEVALWTVIAERDNEVEVSEIYNLAYKS